MQGFIPPKHPYRPDKLGESSAANLSLITQVCFPSLGQAVLEGLLGMGETSFSEHPENGMSQIQIELRRLERRDRWLWAAAAAVMLLLTVAVALFSLSALSAKENPFFSRPSRRSAARSAGAGAPLHYPYHLPAIPGPQTSAPISRPTRYHGPARGPGK